VNPRLLIALVVAGSLALAFALFGALTTGGGGTGGAQARDTIEGARLPAGVRAPDFALRDQDGRAVTMRSLRGRPVVVTFLYTTCQNTCPAQAQQIKGALDQLGHDLPAIAISVDPPRDTADSASHFLAKQGMTGRLRFVLGSRAQLQPLWRRYAVTPQRPGQEHMGRIVLVDAHGFQRIGFPASEATPERLAHDLALLERAG
jgi:protein SCO1/2